MKIASFLFLSLAALVFGAAVSASAATLTQSEIKKFKGVYAGEISGIAGNVSQPNNSTRFVAEIKVTGKRREALPVLIEGLNARSAHFIAWRKPTGSPSRAKFVGFYVGTVTNPVTLLEEPVSGVRTMILVDRGGGHEFPLRDAPLRHAPRRQLLGPGSERHPREKALITPPPRSRAASACR